MPGSSSARKRIAIVGNVTAQGEAKKTLAVDAAAQLGRELANQGYDIVVCSADPRFLEYHVVTGYLAAGKPVPGSVHVSYTAGVDIGFPPHDEAYHWHPDTRSDWEMSFYESIPKTDGVLMLGGGASTLTAGLFALTHEVPLVAFSSFGGTAVRIWNELASRHDIVTAEEHDLLGTPVFTSETAATAVALFGKQAERFQRRRAATRELANQRAKRRRASVLLAAGSFVAFLAILIATLASTDLPSLFVLICILIAGPAVAGISGVSAMLVQNAWPGSTAGDPRDLGQQVVRGLVAGAIAALLTTIPTIMARPDLPAVLTQGKTDADLRPVKEQQQREQARKLIPLALLTGFGAGFAVDQFYRKLQEKELKIPDLPPGF